MYITILTKLHNSLRFHLFLPDVFFLLHLLIMSSSFLWAVTVSQTFFDLITLTVVRNTATG